MIMYGTHLLSVTEELQSVELKTIYDKIKSPDDALLATITRLRILRNLDKSKYVQAKKNLPFFVCAIFSPKFRRKENFAYTEYFVVDIDNLSEKGYNPEDLKKELLKDSRILMCFVSPSLDGLKLIFRLDERCYDEGLYVMFYRAFVHDFSASHNLDQVIDTKTCDTTRACFLSYDPMAFYQETAESVKITDYLDLNNTSSIFATDHSLKVTKNQSVTFVANDDKLPTDPDMDVLQHIKEVLGQKRALILKDKVQVFVPDMLNAVIMDMKRIIEETGIVVLDISDIQYGKKIHSSLGLKKSEINIFYGKKGFSIVQSPKKGCSKELNETVAQILEYFIQINDL